jgi:hypothetical protein
MRDHDPYALPSSPLPAQRGAWPVIATCISGLIAFALLLFGLWEMIQHPGKNPAVVILSFMPLIVTFLYLRRGAKLAFIFSVASSAIFCLLYALVALDAFAQTGLTYLPAVLYPSALCMSFAVCAFAVIRQRPNNSFKPKPLRGSA